MTIHCPECGAKILGEELVEFGGWTLSETNRAFYRTDRLGGHVDLTPSECKIIGILVRAHGRTVSHVALYDICYAGRSDCDIPELKIIDVLVCKIRKKIRDQWNIETFGISWGVGRKLLPAPPPESAEVRVFNTVSGKIEFTRAQIKVA